MEVILLGNPTCIGPNVNSADQLSPAQAASTKYSTIQFKSNVNSIATEKSSSGKIQAYDDCIYLAITSDVCKTVQKDGAEILTNYERDPSRPEFFHDFNDDKTYCDVCFSLQQQRTNPIVCCGVKSCNAGRHKLCFAQGKAPDMKSLKEFFHRCQDHLSRRESGQECNRRQFVPQGNLPPKWNTHGIGEYRGQVIHQHNSAMGLHFNSRSLDVEVRQSSLPSAGKGLFAKRAFKRGETIGYFFGKIVSSARYEGLISDYKECRPIADPVEREFAEDECNGVLRALDLGDSLSDEHDDYKMLVSKQCPVSYINDPIARDPSIKKEQKKKFSANCCIQFPHATKVTPEGLVSWTAFPITATSSVAVDAEFFFDYGYKESYWRTIISRRSAMSYCSPVRRAFVDNFVPSPIFAPSPTRSMLKQKEKNTP